MRVTHYTVGSPSWQMTPREARDLSIRPLSSVRAKRSRIAKVGVHFTHIQFLRMQDPCDSGRRTYRLKLWGSSLTLPELLPCRSHPVRGFEILAGSTTNFVRRAIASDLDSSGRSTEQHSTTSIFAQLLAQNFRKLQIQSNQEHGVHDHNHPVQTGLL